MKFEVDHFLTKIGCTIHGYNLLFKDLCALPTVKVKVLPWVVKGAGGLGAGKTSGAGTRGVSLDVVIGGRTGHSDTNGGESSNN